MVQNQCESNMYVYKLYKFLGTKILPIYQVRNTINIG
jgi:hypothetical protein